MARVEEYKFSGAFLRGYLAGLRKVAGASYPRLLERSGLSQYITRYPPLDLKTVATGREIILLQQEAINLLGLELYLLFLKNVGREFGKNTATYPPLIEALKKAAPVKTPAELKTALEAYVQLTQTVMDFDCLVEVNSEPKGVLLTYLNCIICSGLPIANAKKPFCAFTEASLKETFQLLVNPRVKVEEIWCASMHRQTNETNCKFLVTMPFVA